MAIFITGTESIDNNRRANFSKINLGNYNQGQLDNLTIKGEAVGDMVFNTDVQGLNFWDGEKWVPQPNKEGEAVYKAPGTFTWVCPPGVSKVCAVCVGGGGAGGYAQGHLGGYGGGLGWKNNIPVQGGQSYTVVVGAGGKTYKNQGTGGDSYFISKSTVLGGGGKGGPTRTTWPPSNASWDDNFPSYESVKLVGGRYVGDGGGTGGGFNSYWAFAHGGAGAGGYVGSGGSFNNNNPGDGGKGGGGGAGQDGGNSVPGPSQGNGGGGVGIYGQGENGKGGGVQGMGGENGKGGSKAHGTGTDGKSRSAGYPDGGFPGGGGGHDHDGNRPGKGGGGAVRIIWGEDRAFPKKNTGLTEGYDTNGNKV